MGGGDGFGKGDRDRVARRKYRIVIHFQDASCRKTFGVKGRGGGDQRKGLETKWKKHVVRRKTITTKRKMSLSGCFRGQKWNHKKGKITDRILSSG